MLTEVRDCDLLIVVTFSTFLKRKDMLREKAVSPDHQNPQHSIYIDKLEIIHDLPIGFPINNVISLSIDKCTVYTYTVYMYTAI